MIPFVAVGLAITGDLMRLLFRSRAAIQAENLFLRRQLALYRERKTRRSRPTPATKFVLVALSRFFPWASALAIVKPDTFVRWHRAGPQVFDDQRHQSLFDNFQGHQTFCSRKYQRFPTADIYGFRTLML